MTTGTGPGEISLDTSGAGVYELGGYCAETPGVETDGEEWYYDSASCLVYVRSYSGGSNTSCVGEHVTPVGTQVSSVDHSLGNLTPHGTNILYDTGIRFIDSNNNAVFVVTEWNQTLFDLEYVHILCDCTFEVQATEVIEEEIVVTTDTEINIFFDASGSMNTTLSPLNTMRNTLLQNCLLPFYNNDVNIYNSRVTITSINGGALYERAIGWIATQPSDPSRNVVNLAFADESNGAYEAANPTVSGWTNGSSAGNSDIALLRTNLANATTSTSHRGIIFQVDTLSGGNDAYPQYQAFMNALFSGTGYYAGTAGLSDKTEVSCVQDTVAGSTPQYYVDLIVNAMNNLGYTIPSC